MITLVLPSEWQEVIVGALVRAGSSEVGGVLMAEHCGPNEFAVRQVTVHAKGSFAAFLRKIEDAMVSLTSFFQRTRHDYTRFNYVGEWHSHPSFVPEPSSRDDASMRRIVKDPEVGANFVVLLIVKLDAAGDLVATAHTYLPNGAKHRAVVKLG
jgi:integrative and conjugative element protein (TIGR02256 family)